jgi:hypothetical protein
MDGLVFGGAGQRVVAAWRVLATLPKTVACSPIWSLASAVDSFLWGSTGETNKKLMSSTLDCNLTVRICGLPPLHPFYSCKEFYTQCSINFSRASSLESE